MLFIFRLFAFTILIIGVSCCKKKTKINIMEENTPLLNGTWQLVYRSGETKDGKTYAEGKNVNNGKVDGNGGGGVAGGDSTVITITFDANGKYTVKYPESNNKNWRIATAPQDSGKTFTGNYTFRNEDGGDVLILGGDGSKTVYGIVGDTTFIYETWSKGLTSWGDKVKDKKIWQDGTLIFPANRKEMWKTYASDIKNKTELVADATMASIGYIYVGNIDAGLAEQLIKMFKLRNPEAPFTDLYILGGSEKLKTWAKEQFMEAINSNQNNWWGQWVALLRRALETLKGNYSNQIVDSLVADFSAYSELKEQIREAFQTGALKEWRENTYKFVISIPKARGGVSPSVSNREAYHVHKMDKNELILSSFNKDYFTFDTSRKRLDKGVLLKFKRVK